jgi:hypothetical protein
MQESQFEPIANLILRTLASIGAVQIYPQDPEGDTPFTTPCGSLGLWILAPFTAKFPHQSSMCGIRTQTWQVATNRADCDRWADEDCFAVLDGGTETECALREWLDLKLREALILAAR